MKSKKVMFHCLVIGLICSGISNTNAQENAKPTHTTDDLKTVKAAVESGKAILVDVRSKEEWDNGHVKGAIFSPITDITETKGDSFLKLRLDKSKIIYTHCGAGGRALRAASVLKEKGYDVRALKPGFSELIESGLTEEK